jgi:radical SAM protein with 4Fe4S-binding SPASM domain
MPSENKFLILTPHSFLKFLEEPYLYDTQNDELYELSPEAYQFLLQCSQGKRPPIEKKDEAFIQFCLSEQVIAFSERPIKRQALPNPSPTPSLRYLELQITDRCNLQCHHCYLGEGHHEDFPLKSIQHVLKEFEEIQGLRLLLSGGEPLLHPQFWRINDSLRAHAFRSVLLSNGTLITKEIAKKLLVHEVQISLDGMEQGHESLRGRGTFKKVLLAIDHLQEASIRVSVATMVHKRNLKEFESLANLLQTKKVEEWNVDIPCVEGRLKANQDFWVTPSEGGRFLHYGFGGGFHGSSHLDSCGSHLCAILPNGQVCKCGLYSQEPAGSIEDGLRTCWEKIPWIPLKDLDCKCEKIETCRGGCRYRARMFGSIFGPDPFQCFARGVLKE